MLWRDISFLTFTATPCGVPYVLHQWIKYFCKHKPLQKKSVNNLTASFSNNLQRSPLWACNPDWNLDTQGYPPTQSALPNDPQSQAWRHVPGWGIFGGKKKEYYGLTAQKNNIFFKQTQKSLLCSCSEQCFGGHLDCLQSKSLWFPPPAPNDSITDI